MQNRRGFFGWLVGWVLVACGAETVSGLMVTSSSSGQSAHTHVFTITDAELASPPAPGISREDTGSGHAHLVTLTQAEIESVSSGGTVTITSGNSAGHSHTYAFKKA